MKIALQVGLAWFLGVVAFVSLGFLMIIAFAVESAGFAAVLSGAVVVLFVCLGFAVFDGAWYLRLAWGLAVSLFGVVGTVFLVRFAEHLHLPKYAGWALTGVAYAVMAALFARNWWVRGAGALVLVTVVALAPAATWEAFFRTWARLG